MDALSSFTIDRIVRDYLPFELSLEDAYFFASIDTFEGTMQSTSPDRMANGGWAAFLTGTSSLFTSFELWGKVVGDADSNSDTQRIVDPPLYDTRTLFYDFEFCMPYFVSDMSPDVVFSTPSMTVSQYTSLSDGDGMSFELERGQQSIAFFVPSDYVNAPDQALGSLPRCLNSENGLCDVAALTIEIATRSDIDLYSCFGISTESDECRIVRSSCTLIENDGQGRIALEDGTRLEWSASEHLASALPYDICWVGYFLEQGQSAEESILQNLLSVTAPRDLLSGFTFGSEETSVSGASVGKKRQVQDNSVKRNILSATGTVRLAAADANPLIVDGSQSGGIQSRKTVVHKFKFRDMVPVVLSACT